MECNFYKWYSQALGSTLGIIACIFGYLNGYMFVYSNIQRNFDFLGIDGVISSYFLLPMCVFTLIFAAIRINYEEKTFLNISFNTLNKVLAILTIIIGFLGTRVYFTIPTLLITIGFISFDKVKGNLTKNNTYEGTQSESKNTSHNHSYNYLELEDRNTDTKAKYKEIDDDTNIYIKDYKGIREAKLLNTRKDIAIDLIQKGASTEFIIEITGFSIEDIMDLKNNKNGI